MKIHASNTQELCKIFQDECNALGEKKKNQREDYRLQTDRRDMLYCDAVSDNPNHKLILFLEVDFENMNDVVEEKNNIENEGETKVPSTSNSKFNKIDREFQERKTKVLALTERSREANDLLNMFQEDCLLPNGLNFDNTIRILPFYAQDRKHIALLTEKEIKDEKNLNKPRKEREDKSWSSAFKHVASDISETMKNIFSYQPKSKFLNDKHYVAVKNQKTNRVSGKERKKERNCSCIQCQQKTMELRVVTAKVQVKEAMASLMKSRRRTNRIKYMSDFQVEKAKNDADTKVEECKENLSQTSSRLIAFTEKRERAQAEVRMHQKTYMIEPTEVSETVKSPFANALEQYHEEKLLNPSGETKSNTALPGEDQVFNLTRHVSDQRKKELAIEMNYLKCTSDGSCTQDQLLGFFDQFSSSGEHRIAPECCLLDPENCVCFTGENHVYSLLNVVYVVVFLFKKTILISVVIPSIK